MLSTTGEPHAKNPALIQQKHSRGRNPVGADPFDETLATASLRYPWVLVYWLHPENSVWRRSGKGDHSLGRRHTAVPELQESSRYGEPGTWSEECHLIPPPGYHYSSSSNTQGPVGRGQQHDSHDLLAGCQSRLLKSTTLNAWRSCRENGETCILRHVHEGVSGFWMGWRSPTSSTFWPIPAADATFSCGRRSAEPARHELNQRDKAS